METNLNTKNIEWLTKLYDEFFKILQKEYSKHVYNIFLNNSEIRLESWLNVIPEITPISTEDNIKSIKIKKGSFDEKEEIIDILIPKMINIKDYKSNIKKYLDDIFLEEEWMDIYEYFKHRMKDLQISNSLKLKILEYKKLKMQIDNQNLYEDFLLWTPINIKNIKIPKWLNNFVNKNLKKYKEIWDIELSINEEWKYLASIPNLFIWWIYAVIELQNPINLIWLYYTKLNNYFREWFKIEKLEWNMIIQYKLEKEWQLYIKRIKENKHYYKSISVQ